MFFKIGVLKNFANIHRKTTVLESLFNKVAGRKACNFIKKETPTQAFSVEYCQIFKKSYFYRAPLVAASGLNGLWIFCKELMLVCYH